MSLIVVLLQRDGVRDRGLTRCSGACKAEVQAAMRHNLEKSRQAPEVVLGTPPGLSQNYGGKVPSHVLREAFFPP